MGRLESHGSGNHRHTHTRRQQSARVDFSFLKPLPFYWMAHLAALVLTKMKLTDRQTNTLVACAGKYKPLRRSLQPAEESGWCDTQVLGSKMKMQTGKTASGSQTWANLHRPAPCATRNPLLSTINTASAIHSALFTTTLLL